MPQIAITPWRDETELIKVRAQFYPTSNSQHDQRRKAIDMASIKRWGFLPHAVESTALLTDAILHDNPEKVSINSIRAVYSTAFCRFVTGLVDSAQKGMYKNTMYNIAKQIGLPASFVELRHEATHEDLPGLLVLRQAADRSLTWLWQHYWRNIDEGGNVLGEEDEAFNEGVQKLQEQFRQHFRPYIKARIEVAKKHKPLSSEKYTPLSPQDNSNYISQQVVKICKGKEQILNVLVAVLLEIKFLIPANKSLGASMDGVFLLWDDLLKRLTLHQRSFLRILTDEMSNLLVQPSGLSVQFDSYREAIYLWLVHISTSEPWAASRNKWSFRLDNVVSSCIMGPNHWSLKLSSLLMEVGDEHLKNQWADVVSIQAGQIDIDGDIDTSESESDESDSGEQSESKVDEDGELKIVEHPSEKAARKSIRKLVRPVKRQDRPGKEDEWEDVDEDSESSNAPGWRKWKGPWAAKPIGMI
ncbi:MAG: rRNA-processing protein las1 [Pycnora praestabilis]|nr:MAG: rRNA-processing protein las1 [Pycnora praestabilis]